MVHAGRLKRGRMRHRPSTRIKRFFVRLVSELKEESGAELVEAALVLPLLLVLLLGIVTFGRAYNTYQTITRAAREGAKAAVLTPCADSTYCSGATNYTATDIWNNFVDPVLQSDNLDTAKITNNTIKYVQLDPDDSTPHVCGIQLTFQYPYTFSLPFTGLNLSTINLKTTVRMRLENQPTTCSVGSSY